MTISVGAGGGETSDLAQATRVARRVGEKPLNFLRARLAVAFDMIADLILARINVIIAFGRADCISAKGIPKPLSIFAREVLGHRTKKWIPVFGKIRRVNKRLEHKDVHT